MAHWSNSAATSPTSEAVASAKPYTGK